MYAARLWAVRHARPLLRVYTAFERVLVAVDPLLRRIGYDRLERPVASVEKAVKGFMFDCRMCGQCALSSTGMSCPMNCPKSIRNGPCGGVRQDGMCEVKPEMRCVWVEADRGRGLIGAEADPTAIGPPVDHRLAGRSSWLRVAQEKSARRESRT